MIALFDLQHCELNVRKLMALVSVVVVGIYCERSYFLQTGNYSFD
jgi:hypothetical protein